MNSYDLVIRSDGGIDKYPAKSHARRVAKTLGQKSGLVLLMGTKTAYHSNSDQTRPFRQDRYFYYLSGCNEPDCVLTYDLAKDWLTLFLPPVIPDRFYYDGKRTSIEEARAMYDIDEAKYLLSSHISSSLSQFYSSHLNAQQLDQIYALSAKRLPKDVAAIETLSLQPALDKCRAVKDEYEIRMIRKANELTARAHKDVVLELHNCTTEAEAEAIYMKRCIASLAKEQSYGPIFGSGVNASTLHYVKNDQPFRKSQLLLIDAGCEWQCYASDVTRTIPINKKNPGTWPSKEAMQIYEAVERIQTKCIALMQTGNRFSTISLTAQRLTAEELLRLGILKGDLEEIIKAGTIRAFLPHGLGHHLGLEVHDVQPPLMVKTGGKSKKTKVPSVFCGARSASCELLNERVLDAIARKGTLFDPPMEPGNVITVEPGIYFNAFVLEHYYLSNTHHSKFIDKKTLQRYIPVGGVRIEDDILVTKFGNENLTTAPKGEEMLVLFRNHVSKT